MTTFTAMTWNVENLFRPESGASQADRQRFHRKLALLADVINRLDPEVVALQEVGGEEPLLDLNKPSMGPTRTAQPLPSPTAAKSGSPSSRSAQWTSKRT